MDAKDFKALHEIVKQARLNLDDVYWDYLVGGSDTETTLKRNRLAIDKRALRPKVLNDVSSVSTAGSLLGSDLALPVILAPIGALQMFDSGGGASAARSADEMGVMSMSSSVCEPDIEEIAEAAPNAARVYQVYVRGDDDWLNATIERVMASNYLGLCITVDTARVSRRERDIAKRVIPTSQATARAGNMDFQKSLSWKTIERLKKSYDFPLILKGICREDDALKALDHGVDVIYVSNHGGRQLDQSMGSLDAFVSVANVVRSKAELVVDGGFYRGTDVLKAIALGANAVGIGRLEGWALAAGGVPVLNRCIDLLQREVAMAMTLCGVTSLAELDASFVTESDVTVDSDVLSAFPLLNEGY